MKREFRNSVWAWFSIAGCAALVTATMVGCVTPAADNSASQASEEMYAGLNCSQLETEYYRLSRAIMINEANSGPGGSALPVAIINPGEVAPRQLARAISTSDALHRMEHIREAHLAKPCWVKLLTGQTDEIALAVDRAMGGHEYSTNCAVCHGVAGKGGGWLTRYLKVVPPVLSQIKKNNGGVFPFDHVYEVIDGRKDVQLHGPRDMPVWGRVYKSRVTTTFAIDSAHASTAEEIMRVKIRALVDFIAHFQE